MEKSSNCLRCKRCNRVLKDPIAQSRGYGTVCWKIHLENEMHSNKLFKLVGNSSKNK